jgi:diguanylate cyclase (GGDEF)-like protein
MTFNWSTHQLTEFFSAVSTSSGEREAGRAAVERAAEALDAEVAALIVDGEVRTSHGLGAGPLPGVLAEIGRVAGADWPPGASPPGAETIDVPSLGPVFTCWSALGESVQGLLVVCRVDAPFAAEERQMLRGMAQVLALSLRSLRTLAAERALREEREKEAAERLALLCELRTRERLLETLLAIQRAIFTRRPLQEVLDTVTRGASTVLDGAGVALVLKDHGPDRGLTLASTCALRDGPGTAHLAVAAEAVAVDRVSRDVDGTVIAAPVHLSGDVAGSLVVEVAHTVRPEDERQELLAALAQQVSLAITDARTVAAVHEAHHDTVTGLPNRALFLQRLEHASRVARRRGTGITVLFIDLDRFKAVNDSLGHGAGDELLATVAERIRHRLRSSDTVGRLGGDEFAVLLEEVAIDVAVQRAEAIIHALNEPFQVAGRDVSISASIGVAVSASADVPSGELLGQADVAMYCAKKGGAGRVSVYAPKMHAAVVERMDLQADLQRSIGRGELSLDYQPLVRLDSRRPVGVEALLRWNHPSRGLVSPGVFIPIAENTEIIFDVGRWVLREAGAQVAEWRRLVPELGVNVNVSARQVMDRALAGDVAEILALTGLPASALTLELTESVLASDPDAALRQLLALKREGVRLSIDDFGTGYSSLSYLRQLPVDQLKIDRSFVAGLGHGSADVAIVRTIIELGRSLGLDVVAEGIETDEQAAALLSLGCALGQGYGLCRPQRPAATLTHLLRDAPFPFASLSA